MAEYLVNLTNGKMDEKGLYWPLYDLLNQTGVLYAGALLVQAQTTPDMTVKVAGGTSGHSLVFLTTSGDMYYGRNTATKNVTITANASGVTKTDAIVAYADLAAGSATSNNPGALKLVAVRRSGSNTGQPTAGEISSAVSSNPYLVLAYVTVNNGASSINSGNITDARIKAGISTGLVTTPSLLDGAVTTAKVADSAITQAKAPFALAMHSNNLKMQIVVEGTPFWNGLAHTAYQSANVTFNQLGLVHAAWMIPGKGPFGNNAVTALEWALEEQPYSNFARFIVRNLGGGPVFSNFCIYIAIGTPV